MRSDRKALNLACALGFVVLIASSLSAAVENFVGMIVVVVLATPFLIVAGREAFGAISLARELRPRNDPTPEQIAAWLVAHPPPGPRPILDITPPLGLVTTRTLAEIEAAPEGES